MKNKAMVVAVGGLTIGGCASIALNVKLANRIDKLSRELEEKEKNNKEQMKENAKLELICIKSETKNNAMAVQNMAFLLKDSEDLKGRAAKLAHEISTISNKEFLDKKEKFEDELEEMIKEINENK